MTTDELYKLADYHGVSLVEIFPVAHEIMAALIKAKVKHAAMRGSHEGYAVILEEIDELWDEVKKDAYHFPTEESLVKAAHEMCTPPASTLPETGDTRDVELASLRLAFKAKDARVRELEAILLEQRNQFGEWMQKGKIPEQILKFHMPLTKEQQATLKEMFDRSWGPE